MGEKGEKLDQRNFLSKGTDIVTIDGVKDFLKSMRQTNKICKLFRANGEAAQ